MTALGMPGTEHPPRPRSARGAILTMFFVNGAALATWLSMIPAVQQKLGLSAGQLGVALLGLALGAVLAMPVTGWLVGRTGGRRVGTLSAVVYCAMLAFLWQAPTLSLLAVTLLVFGAASGMLDVAMNIQGAEVEGTYRRPLMSTFHGVYSLGGFAGALLGSGLAAAGLTPAIRALLPALALAAAALVGAYSPLRHLGVRTGDRCAVVGLGGLGHMGVKLLHALRAETAVLSHAAIKEQEARRLGAEDFVVSRESGDLRRYEGRFDFVLDIVSAAHDYNAYLALLKRDGTLILVGMPGPSPLDAGVLANRRRRIIGSVIGGIRETQEMLEFCAAHEVQADVEVIQMQDVNEAYERVLGGAVRFRFVIHLASLTG